VLFGYPADLGIYPRQNVHFLGENRLFYGILGLLAAQTPVLAPTNNATRY